MLIVSAYIISFSVINIVSGTLSVQGEGTDKKEDEDEEEELVGEEDEGEFSDEGDYEQVY